MGGNLWNYHTVLWKFRNFTATIFSQKFRQINVWVKNFTINWFDGIKFSWQKISRFSTLWMPQCHSVEFTQFLYHGFWKKNSVKTTSLVKSFTVKLISRNISQLIQKFRKLHTVCVNYRIFSHLQLFCENNRLHGI